MAPVSEHLSPAATDVFLALPQPFPLCCHSRFPCAATAVSLALPVLDVDVDVGQRALTTLINRIVLVHQPAHHERLGKDHAQIPGVIKTRIPR